MCKCDEIGGCGGVIDCLHCMPYWFDGGVIVQVPKPFRFTRACTGEDDFAIVVDGNAVVRYPCFASVVA